MQLPAGGSQRPRTKTPARAAVLGSLTIPGDPSQVRTARAFVARTLGTCHVKVDSDAATLLTSEIVTNAILHTKSGIDGGTVTIVILGVSHGVLIEVIDAGSADEPVVKGDLYAANGHGLFMVQQLAAQWGYLREPGGTTVWFHLPVPGEPAWTDAEASPADQLRRVRDALLTGQRTSSPAPPPRASADWHQRPPADERHRTPPATAVPAPAATGPAVPAPAAQVPAAPDRWAAAI